MKVVPDTTVFENGFNSRSADVEVLEAFLKRSGSELCVPIVVFQEAINRICKRLKEANEKLNALLRLTGDEDRFRRFDVESTVRAFEASLDGLVKGTLNGRILGYPKVEHQELVRRDLDSVKPFAASGKGYRDALIWFSIVELLQVGDDEIIFLTSNSNDWWESSKGCRLHRDLQRDLVDRGIRADRIRLLPSLADFNEQYAIEDLPKDTRAAVRAPIDYFQVLRLREEEVRVWIQGVLPRALRAATEAWVGELEVIAASLPDEIDPMPIRDFGEHRRLLQFSALYRVAAEFVIKKADLPVWSSSFSFHMRRDWEDGVLKVQATIRVRALFRMIMRGDETEAFSVVSLMATAWATPER